MLIFSGRKKCKKSIRTGNGCYIKNKLDSSMASCTAEREAKWWGVFRNNRLINLEGKD